MSAPSVNWSKLKTEYVTTKISLKKLSLKHSVAYSAVCKRSRKDDWILSREEYNKKVAEKTINKVAEAESSKLANLINAADKMTYVVAKTLNDTEQFNKYIVDGVKKTEEGDISCKVETTFGKVDTKAIREMAGALKDLTSVIRNLNNLPTLAEMEARELAIKRFELEKTKLKAEEDGDRDVRVVFDKELEKYAK